MNTITALHRFIHSCKQARHPLRWIPVSQPELDEIKNDMMAVPIQSTCKRDEILGHEVWNTPLADPIRCRIQSVDVPIAMVSETVTMDRLSYKIYQDENYALNQLHLRLERSIARNDTTMTLTVIVDPWLWLKKRFPRLQKRWPIRRQSFEVQGSVLYPYLNVQLPLNRHTVKFAVLNQ